MSDTTCPCGSGLPLATCCQPLHLGQPATSAEALMRSRYSAYVLGNIDYLRATTLPVQQSALDTEAMREWSNNSQWLGLSVEAHQPLGGAPPRSTVTFVARWRDAQGEHAHREHSAFVQLDDRWYFIDPTVRINAGRNDSCPCGSGRKFKKCCAALL